MVYPSQTPSLKSDGIGILLVVFLWLGLGLAGLSLLFSLLELMSPDTYASVRDFDAINSVSQLPLSIITVILFLVWMYQLHRDGDGQSDPSFSGA